MAFPDDIETGIGLAGPTANIGHEAAHAAPGIPRLLQAIQTSIGTDAARTAWTPTWNTGTAPDNNEAFWSKYGVFVWFSIRANWDTSTNTSAGWLRVTGGLPSWGTPAGFGASFPFKLGLTTTGTEQDLFGTAHFDNSSIYFYSQTNNLYLSVAAGTWVTAQGVFVVLP